jgi:signal peptidase I
VNGVLQDVPPRGRFEPNDVEDPIEMYHTFPASKKYTHRNYGPIRVPKKGDTVYFNTKIDFDDNRILIKREGHSANWFNEKAEIDGKVTNFYIIEQDYYFGMGDNRDRSSDSRYWGFIPRKAILGSPIICWLSWEMYDENGYERNVFQKFANIRWDRMGRLID